MSRVPRCLRSELIYAAAAANAWLRGLSLPNVALHYRYEPITAFRLIDRCCSEYGRINVEPWVTADVLSVCALAERDLTAVRRGRMRSRRQPGIAPGR